MWRKKLTSILLIGLVVVTSMFALADETFRNPGTRSVSPLPTSFVMPSGNIYCALIGADQNLLRCEIGSFLKPMPPQPYPGYCAFDWGAGFLLPPSGPPEILCISDTIAGSDYTLSYGSTWMKAGFTCVSQTTGLTCTNTTGQGFVLSRRQWKVF